MDTENSRSNTNKKKDRDVGGEEYRAVFGDRVQEAD